MYVNVQNIGAIDLIVKPRVGSRVNPLTTSGSYQQNRLFPILLLTIPFLSIPKVLAMSLLSSTIKSDLNSSKNQIQDASADITKEFKNFIFDIEDLLKSSNSLTGDDLIKVREQLNQRVKKARTIIEDASENIFQHARRSAALTNEYVHQQPWTVIGASTAVSFLLGYLLASRN